METARSIQPEAKPQDAQLAEWFGQGLTDQEILDMLAEQGIEADEAWVAERRMALREKTLSVVAQRGASMVASMARSHRSARLREMEDICRILHEGEQWCKEKGAWNLLPRIADTHLKALRQIAEEMGFAEAAAQSRNVYLAYLRDAPPEVKEAVAQKLLELQALIKSASGLQTQEETLGLGGD